MLNKVVIKESLFYMFGNVLTLCSNFLVIYLLMGRFSLQIFGVYSYVTEYIAIFTFFSDAGLTSYAIREISANVNSAREKYIGIQGSQMYISLISFLLAISISIIINGNHYLVYIIITALGLSFNSLFAPCLSLLITFHEKGLILKRNIIDSFGMLLFLGIGIYWQFPLVYFMFLLCVRSFTNLLFFFYVKNTTRYKYFGRLNLDINNFYAVIKGCGFYTIVMAANVIYNKIDILMVEKYLGVEKVATLAAASKLVYPFMFISGAVMNVIFPRLVKNFVSNNDFVNNVISTCKIMALIGFVISVSLYFGSDLIFLILFQHKYDESIGIFKILVWYLFIVFLHAPIANALVAENKIKDIAFINIFFIIVKVALNVYVIPRYNIYGAAFVSIFCEILIFFILIYLFFIKKGYNFRTITKAFMKKNIYLT